MPSAERVEGIISAPYAPFGDGDLRDADGRANDGDNTLGVQQDQEGNAVSYSTSAPLATFAEFDGLSAGDHTVAIYVRGNATSCTLNNGNFNQQVVVEEYQTSGLSTFDVAGATDDGSPQSGE